MYRAAQREVYYIHMSVMEFTILQLWTATASLPMLHIVLGCLLVMRG